jgi:hypothetical protein
MTEYEGMLPVDEKEDADDDLERVIETDEDAEMAGELRPLLS